MNLLIAGDFVPQYRTLSEIEQGNYSSVFGCVKKIVEDCDYSILNLEAPIVYSQSQPIKKTGPNLRAPINTIDAIKYAGFKGVTLANNHFYDYGNEGVEDSLKVLKNSNIDFVGAGHTAEEAAKVLYKQINSFKIAFINCCEHEYSIVSDKSYGANPLDPISVYNTIKVARKEADYVIVVVHGGIEEYQLPTPRMVKTYRFFVDAGADVVVNHHQHCYSGYEEYQGRPIIYGLGNFSFDRKSKRHSLWNEGFMLKLTFERSEIKFGLIPYKQGDDKCGVCLLNKKEQDKFYAAIDGLNKIITNPKILREEHEAFMNRTIKNQKYVLCPYHNKYLAALYVRGFLPGFLPINKWRLLHNKIMCESHRERFLYFLDNKLK